MFGHSEGRGRIRLSYILSCPDMAQRWTALEGHTVLVVDDNEDSRNVLRTMLEAHGARVCDGGLGSTRRATPWPATCPMC